MTTKDSVNGNQELGSEPVVSPSPALVGRELDAVVAERVMGKCVHVLIADMDTSHRAFKCRKCFQRGFDFVTDYVGRVLIPAAYSADIAAAMEVLEKLYEQDWAVEIHRSVVVDDDWMVEFASISPRVVKNVFAKTLPEAICRAALAAINEPAREAENNNVTRE